LESLGFHHLSYMVITRLAHYVFDNLHVAVNTPQLRWDEMTITERRWYIESCLVASVDTQSQTGLWISHRTFWRSVVTPKHLEQIQDFRERGFRYGPPKAVPCHGNPGSSSPKKVPQLRFSEMGFLTFWDQVSIL